MLRYVHLVSFTSGSDSHCASGHVSYCVCFHGMTGELRVSQLSVFPGQHM